MGWLLVLDSLFLSTLVLGSETLLSLEPYLWEEIYQVCIPFLLPHYGLDHWWGPCLFVLILIHLIYMGVLSCIPSLFIHKRGLVNHIIFPFVKYFLAVICFLIVKIYHSEVLQLRRRKNVSLCLKVRSSIYPKSPLNQRVICRIYCFALGCFCLLHCGLYNLFIYSEFFD